MSSPSSKSLFLVPLSCVLGRYSVDTQFERATARQHNIAMTVGPVGPPSLGPPFLFSFSRERQAIDRRTRDSKGTIRSPPGHLIGHERRPSTVTVRLVRGGERSAGTGVPYKYFGGRRWTRTWWIESYEVESQGYQPKPTFSLFKSTQAFMHL